jgi:predicted transcriptional regulator
VNKTHVVYNSGLNFYTIKAYLDTLDKNNLIETIQGGPHTLYRTTQKGKDALVHFTAIEELFRID